MNKLLLMFLSIILINCSLAQSNCEYLIHELKDKLLNDRPQNYNSALNLSQAFSADWMITGCDRNSNEFKIIKNELKKFVESIYLAKDPDTFHFSFFKDQEEVELKVNFDEENNLEKILLENIEFEEEEEEEEIIDYNVVEGCPIFPGCKPSEKSSLSAKKEEDHYCLNMGIMKHIRKNFRYPKISQEMGIQEKIYVKFVIDKTGSITNVKIVRGEDKYLKEEAIRLVKSLPKMTPAHQRGEPVSVNYTMPINFMLK
mgnify:CR=1 FL=1